MLRPEFDAIAVKVYILWQLRDSQLCPNSLLDLSEITFFNNDVINAWAAGCDKFDLTIDWNGIQQSLYMFTADSNLTFEFIQLRRWLIDIGCPMSLIYRVTRNFYLNFDVSFGSIDSYQFFIRRFVFNGLRGFVSERDFVDLEGAMLGGGFGGILQRMWAFRGFRINNVPREMCDEWFGRWRTLGYDFDITTWVPSDWNFQFNFDLSFVVVSPPVLTYNFDNLQQCLVDYLVDKGYVGISLERSKLTIDAFDSTKWNGRIDSVIELLDSRQVPEVLHPEFDVTGTKLFILWKLRDQALCPGALDALIQIPSFNNYVLTNWLRSCPGISQS